MNLTAPYGTLNGPRRVAVSTATLLAVVACSPAPPQTERDAPASVAETADPAGPTTLKAIMQGLEADMAAGAHGLWVDDPIAVGVAAHRIADHPHVTPEQMTIIQATLGDEFAEFARRDHVVHDAAVELAEVAAAEGAVDLLPGYIRIQEGCTSCHSAFRARVSEALNAPGG